MERTKFIYEDNIGCVSLINHFGTDSTAIQSARVSFDKDDLSSQDMNSRDIKLLKYLLKNKHTSPFEHSSLSFRIKCPLYVRSQIMRHRTFSYNEVSRRYTSENLEFYIPKVLRTQAEKNLQCSKDEEIENQWISLISIQSHVSESIKLYEELLKDGVCREQARSVLPQSMYTTFWMTGNLLNWMKFLKLRLDPHTQKECQLVANAILGFIQEEFPLTIETAKQVGFL